MPERTLAGRTALVTGSGRNIGEAIAYSLARLDANVVINVRASTDDGRRVSEAVRALGGESILIVADVSHSTEVNRMAAEATGRFGVIDILVNNVGISPMVPLLEAGDDHWDLVIRTSLSSACHCTRALVKGMSDQRWGRIINIGGQAGLRGTKFKAANASAKAGLIGLTREIANEFGARGVTCNHVGPGQFEQMHEVVYYEERSAELDPGFVQRWKAQIPAERLGRPEDVAEACAFLASDGASYINGQTLLVNGGMMFV